VDDRFERREEWVPPLRLKVPSDQGEHWQAREDKFAARVASCRALVECVQTWVQERATGLPATFTSL
jgi:hypothetical protein